jgi:hypothetical protein
VASWSTAASAAGAVALSLLLSGCSGTQDDPVRRAADSFYAALADGDGADACAMLSPRTASEVEQSAQKPCAKAILEEDIPDVTGGDGAPGPREVSAYGTSAQVRYDGETAFLARYDDGWRVVAAGCTPGPRATYDCQVEAG